MQKIKRTDEKKTFALIFEPLNVHLTKDVGSIPYVLGRDYNYDSYIFCHDIGQEFTNQYVLQFLKIIKVKPIKYLQRDNFRKFYFLSYVWFLLKNAKNIDVLQLYHYTKPMMVTAFVYKLLNPKGIAYLKLDARVELADRMRANYFVKNAFDIVSAEIGSVFEALSERCFKRLGNKLSHLPNGIDDLWMRENGYVGVTKDDKENLIITVGRIGTDQKNNRMMLEALSGIGLGDWKIIFIGPIEKSFTREIESFYEADPALKSKVIFTGEISDRHEILSWYKKAKCFCLTSIWEGFPLVLCEALYFGCEIISTPIEALPDLTNDGEFGYCINTSQELKSLLQKIVAGQIDPCANMEKIITHGKRFYWTEICGKLDKLFNGIKKNIILK